jgi:hypothetical protein
VRFILLVRSGVRFVVSCYRHGRYVPDEIERYRRWYTPDEIERRVGFRREWAEHRPRADEVGDMSAEEWGRLDPFSRCCWHWGWTNRKIRDGLNRSAATWMMVRLEDLSASQKAISEFIGLETTSAHGVPVLNKTNAESGRRRIVSGIRPSAVHLNGSVCQ